MYYLSTCQDLIRPRQTPDGGLVVVNLSGIDTWKGSTVYKQSSSNVRSDMTTGRRSGGDSHARGSSLYADMAVRSTDDVALACDADVAVTYERGYPA
eukprot:2940398-Pyramimonas_sp.AAC.1